MKSYNIERISDTLGQVPHKFFERCAHRLVLPKRHRINIIESLVDQDALTTLLIDEERWSNFTTDLNNMVESPILLQRVFAKLLPLTTVKVGTSMLTALQVSTIVRSEAAAVNAVLDEFAIFAYTGLLVQLLNVFKLADERTSYQHLRENAGEGALSVDNLLNILVADDIENALLDATQAAQQSVSFKSGDIIAPIRLQEAIAVGLRSFAHSFSLINVRRMGYSRVLSNIRMYLVDPTSELLARGYGEALNSAEFNWLISNASIIRIALKNSVVEDTIMLDNDFRDYISKIVRTLQTSDRVRLINNAQYGLFTRRSRGVGIASELVSVVGTAIGNGDLRPVVVARDVFSSFKMYNVHFGYEKHLSALPSLPSNLIKNIMEHSFNVDRFNTSQLNSNHTLFVDFSNVKLRDRIDVALMLAPFSVYAEENLMSYQFVWQVNLSNTIFGEQFNNIAKTLVINDVDLVFGALAQDTLGDLELESAFLSEDVPLNRKNFYGVWNVPSMELKDLEIHIPAIGGAGVNLPPLIYELSRDLLLPDNTSLLVGTAWRSVKRELSTSLAKHLEANQDIATQTFKTSLAYQLKDWLRSDLALASLHGRLVQRAAQYYVEKTKGQVSLSDVLYNTGLSTALGLQLAYDLIDLLGGGDRIGFASKLVDSSIIATFYNTK